MGKLVPYYRVSTRKQGESGLGLEAQVSFVSNYARTGSHEIIVSYQEIETGKRSDRPELAKAIAYSKRAKLPREPSYPGYILMQVVNE